MLSWLAGLRTGPICAQDYGRALDTTLGHNPGLAPLRVFRAVPPLRRARAAPSFCVVLDRGTVWVGRVSGNWRCWRAPLEATARGGNPVGTGAPFPLTTGHSYSAPKPAKPCCPGSAHGSQGRGARSARHTAKNNKKPRRLAIRFRAFGARMSRGPADGVQRWLNCSVAEHPPAAQERVLQANGQRQQEQQQRCASHCSRPPDHATLDADSRRLARLTRRAQAAATSNPATAVAGRGVQALAQQTSTHAGVDGTGRPCSRTPP